MNLLHTSDWHLGRTLHGRPRYDEHQAFLDWLIALMAQEQVDALLVAGDIFDTTTPSNRAQALYYRFLCRVAATGCRHVVVIGGNHDSPSFLDAPRELLRALNVHVVGAAANDPTDEVLLLRDAAGRPELIVCAVPYLRDRDLRTAEAGETLADKERKLLEGLRAHYAAAGAAAERLQADAGGNVPIVGMGHLFTAGGQTLEGDGVRELYVGTLAHVHASLFPACMDYVALGHLHVPQAVGGNEAIRYSGSPLAMGFGEAGQQKSVCLVQFEQRQPRVRCQPIPVFQPLARVRGDWDAIAARLQQLAQEERGIWLEIVYEGNAVVGDLRERVQALTEGTQLDVLRLQDRRVQARALGPAQPQEALDELDETEVFARCLDAQEVPAAQRGALQQTYREALALLQADDPRAE